MATGMTIGNFNPNSLSDRDWDNIFRSRDFQRALARNGLNTATTGQAAASRSRGLLGTIGEDMEKTISDIFNVPAEARGALNDIKQAYESLKNMGQAWGDIDEAVSKFTKTLGGSREGYIKYRDSILKDYWNRRLGAKYGISTEEIAEIEQNYQKAIGRRVGIQSSDRENAAAMTSVMGADQTGELISRLENFGVNIGSAADMAGKMFKDASDYGLSFSEYSQTVIDNLEVAQNYTFKNGIKGLESMAKKAMAVKFDLKNAVSFASKLTDISGGGIEGAVESAAQLQVLGGQFSALADPLGMLNEGLNDLEGLQDRMLGMFKNMGTFNRATGQVEISAFNKQRIKAAASAMGIDPNEMMKTVMTSAKRNEVESQMGGAFNGDKKLKEFLLNTASFNENGTAGVTDKEGNFWTLDQIRGNADLQQSLIKENQTDSDNIRDIATELRGLNSVVEGIDKQIRNKEALTITPTAAAMKGAATDPMNSLLLSEAMGTIDGINDFIGGTIENAADTIRGLFEHGQGILKPIGDVVKTVTDIGGHFKDIFTSALFGTKKAAKGGFLQGPSHANGGMRVQGTNLEVEGGEYIVNKYATAQNRGLLDTINNSNNPAALTHKNRTLQFGEGGILPKMDSIIDLMATNNGMNMYQLENQARPAVENTETPAAGTVKPMTMTGRQTDIKDIIAKYASDERERAINSVTEDYSSFLKDSERELNSQFEQCLQDFAKIMEDTQKQYEKLQVSPHEMMGQQPTPYIWKETIPYQQQYSEINRLIQPNANAIEKEKEKYVVSPTTENNISNILAQLQDLLKETKTGNNKVQEIKFQEQPRIKLDINITGVNNSMQETFKNMLSDPKFANDLSAAVEYAFNNKSNKFIFKP